jgi:hypothetical protein
MIHCGSIKGFGVHVQPKQHLAFSSVSNRMVRIEDLQEDKCRLDLEFERQLEQHSQADCRQLASMMYTKLPLELRELIYQYLYYEDAPVPVGSYHFTTYVPESLRSDNNDPPAHSEPFIVTPEGATRQDHSIERDESIVYPDSRLLDPAYLGHNVARDASIYYYRSNTFSICTLENALSDFLFRDPIHNFTRGQSTLESAKPLGLLPIEHVCNLEIRVKYEHYYTYFTFYDNLHDGERLLIQGIFEVLHDFSSRVNHTIASHLHIEICMMTAFEPTGIECQLDRMHTNLLEAIRVPLYELKHDLGANIKVIHYDERCRPFPKNVTAIFQLPKDQWTEVYARFHSIKSSAANIHTQEKESFEAAGLQYSPLRYYISRKSREGSMGFDFHATGEVLTFRWGLKSAFDSSCTQPIAEFGRWPNAIETAYPRVLVDDEGVASCTASDHREFLLEI